LEAPQIETAALRILMLNFEYPPLGGGGSPVTRGLARALVSRGHGVDVVTMGFRGLPAEELDDGVRVFRVPGLRSRVELSHVHELALYVWAAIGRARTLAAAEPYDVCHAHFLLPSGIVAHASRRSPGFPPYVVTAHGSDLPGYNPDRFTFLHRFTPPLIRAIARRSHGVIVPSAALEQLMLSRFPEAAPALIRIANGVDVDRFAPGLKESRILVASRLFERKGVQHVVEALAGLPGSHELDVAGDGPERAALERQAAEAGVRARFHGWLPRERLDRFFERAAIFVLATASDNFPVSLLEAMASRCAIVTTRAGGCPEVVGDTALLVDAGDVAGLREALRRLIGDPVLARDLGERASERARERFGWGAIAARHEEVYRKASNSEAA
jgi:glycosyltransferase involved in cell wall biosynthesis